MPIEKIDSKKKDIPSEIRVLQNDNSAHILKKQLDKAPKEEVKRAIIPEQAKTLRERITPLRSTESSLQKHRTHTDESNSIDV